MSDNELICEFMGYERSTKIWDNDQYAYTMKLPEVFNKQVVPSDMKFDTSYDWIMPVVDRIENLGLLFMLNRNTNGKNYCYFSNKKFDNIHDFDGVDHNRLSSIYKSVTKFLRHLYNDNKL